MNLKKIFEIFNVIKDRLPSTYPRPKLAFYEDERCMIDNDGLKYKDDENVHALVNPETWTIKLPLNMTFEYIGTKGNTYLSTIPINKIANKKLAHTILHEIGHLYAGERFGYESKQYSDEAYCDKFAERWLKVLINDGLLSP